MKLLLGPILHLENGTASDWCFSVHVVIESASATPPLALKLRFDSGDVTVGALTLVADFSKANGSAIWCWSVRVPRGPREQWLGYKLLNRGKTIATIDNVAIPATSHLPRLAFFSCNGFSSADLRRKTAEPNALWRQMRIEHETGKSGGDPDCPSGVHALVGGGDQVYADSLDVLQELDKLSEDELRGATSSPARRKTALSQYLALYQERWSQTDPAYVFARVPGVFTWDDHDIFDGWGSQHDFVQKNAAYRDIYEAARDAFSALQLGGWLASAAGGRRPSLLCSGSATRTTGHLAQTITFYADEQELTFFLLDSRSGRTNERVFDEAQWTDFKKFLTDRGQAAIDEACHLLVVSSIPLVHLRFRAVSWILSNVVPGVQEIEDDLLDQWEHPAHLGERSRLLHTLLDHQRASGTRVTLLSGDVHAGAVGHIESTRATHREPNSLVPARIVQLTSSGIVHPSPNTWLRGVLELLGADGKKEFDPGMTTELVPIDSRTERLWTRNFLFIDVESTSGGAPSQLWARFVAEDWPITRLITVPVWDYGR
ncbi:MAG: alkaline phosphatase D family protein [Phycisphaerae bacterium]|nr:alkaline phosphatase D family protein [Phycisphaerae bacterium]